MARPATPAPLWTPEAIAHFEASTAMAEAAEAEVLTIAYYEIDHECPDCDGEGGRWVPEDPQRGHDEDPTCRACHGVGRI